MKLLVTGFEPYGGLAENPSATIVRELPRRAAVRPGDYPGLRVAILPTEFAKAEHAIRELLQTDVPDVLLALGVAPRAQGWHVPLCSEQVDTDTAQVDTDTHQVYTDRTELAVGTLPCAKLVEAVECCIRVIHSMAGDAGGESEAESFATREGRDSLASPSLRCRDPADAG